MTNALFIGLPEDVEYLPSMKPFFLGAACYVNCQPASSANAITTVTHLELYCAKREITKVVTTSGALLNAILKRKVSLKPYVGSLFHAGSGSHGIEIVIISPLKHLFTVPYGKFLAKRLISKVITPQAWREPTAFDWTLLQEDNIEQFYSQCSQSMLLSEDLETFSVPHLGIRCIGFSTLLPDGKSHTAVLPLTSMWALAWLRKINLLPAPKIFQNGKYDCAYLLRFNAPPVNYIYDTANFMHSWYSELPKDLAFQNAFFLRDVIYWKDLAKTTDLHEYYRYCAMDAWATLNIFITQVLTAPAWAVNNYVLEFPLVHPCMLSEATGLIRDESRLKVAASKAQVSQAASLKSLQIMTGKADFNPSSPTQVGTLLKILGCGDITSTEESDLAKASFRHPLNARILDAILDYRGERKLTSTYLGEGENRKEFGTTSTILFALNPHGTDTGRLASKEHHFWCGLQIQNVPRGASVKSTLQVPPEFVCAECDLEQAESRDTANIVGDERYIAAVSGTKDFHSTNAAAFFGIPYDRIFDDATRKTLDKALRDLAKRVNHGANYNMGARVLVQTMGLKKIYEAAALLKIPSRDPLVIGENLLSRFHSSYPGIAGEYYPAVKHEIATTEKLTSRAYHHTQYNLTYNPDPASYINSRGDWTRYCFGNPEKSKTALNAYVAHCPQSLNARTLNEAYLAVFYRIALPNPTTFRLIAQIHDSILFAFKQGHEHLALQVQELMQIPVTVRDVRGQFRTFTVPAALKIAKDNSPYWGDCE